MGLSNKSSLKSLADVIRHEFLEGQNTAERVGRVLEELIDSTDLSFNIESQARSNDDNEIRSKVNIILRTSDEAYAESKDAKRRAVDALATANSAVAKAVAAESTASSAAALVAQLRADLDALHHDNATEAIESFCEILAFLDGCKDDETLLAKLTEIKGLITEEAHSRQSDVAALDGKITAEVVSRTDADELLQKQISEHSRKFHYLPDNFATEKALFTAAGTYTIGTQPIKPGALLLGCVDECWGVYQYVYFDDESEVSAQSEEAVQAVPASAPTIAPPAVKHDANVSNPENWVRLATIEDVAALKKLVPVVELTAEEIAALLPADESQIATLELDAEDEAGADQPATSEALERFRARYREMRGRSVFKPKEVYNPNDYINYEHE